LTHKAQEIGYESQVILAGRRINDAMGLFVAGKTLALLAEADQAQGLSVNVLGVTFKENCSDTRNSQVFSLVKHLVDDDIQVYVADPLADPVLVERDHGIELVPIAQLSPANALVIAVPHQVFGNGKELISKLIYSDGILVDVKSVYRDVVVNRPDLTYWSL
jgi:UDP-N-acetyl-D-galactosamine dehydrogenase